MLRIKYKRYSDLTINRLLALSLFLSFAILFTVTPFVWGLDIFPKTMGAPKVRVILELRPNSGLLTVSVSIPKGSHIYSIEEDLGTRVEIHEPGIKILKKLRESPPTQVYDEVLGKEVKVHKNGMELMLTVGLPAAMKRITGLFHYRICNNFICSLPQRIDFQAFSDSLR